MLLGFAGFEDNNLLEISVIGAPTVVTTPAPRTGSRCLELRGGSYAFFHSGWQMRVNSSEFYFQYAIKRSITTLYSTGRVFQWRDSANVIMGCFTLDHTNAVYKAYVGDLITLAGVMTTPIGSSWVVIEGYIKISAGSDGRIVIRANGIPEIDFTGITQPGASSEVNHIRHGNFNSIYTTNYQYFDDIIVNDATGTSFNSRPMGIKCHKVAAPLANGNYAQWTPSAGQNFECIDETPPSMDDYVEGAAGEKDSYAFGDAPVSLTGFAGVVVRYYGQGNGDIKRLCRHGGVDYLSDAFTVPGTFNKVDDVMPEKPGGGGWDETVFNACEFGMEHQ